MAETTYLRNALNARWLKGTPFPVYANLYVGLTAANPTGSGSFASEIVSAGYGRRGLVLTAAPYSNSEEIVWIPESFWPNVTNLFIADSSQGGNMLMFETVGPIVAPGPGKLIRIQAGNLTFT